MAIESIVKKLVTWKRIFTGRKAIFLVIFAILASGLFFVDFSFAQANAAAPAAQTGIIGDSIWTTLLNGIAWLMMKVAQYCLSLVMFVLTFIIEIASYNGYLNSSAVNTGWVMVRDLTNMIFVIALLAIAFGTILGIENYEWKHMLFKLVSAAILVNFSRIICGIIIDVAQVVMVTFLNGIAATLGGNFIRAFSLEKIQSFDAAVNGGQIDPYSVFLASAAALFVSVTILVVMAIMLAMLIARMIVLWVLIVLSPIAFVLGVLRKTEAYASEWWSEFGKNVITGPVLVFFIWLTLVTVGNGVVNQEILQNANGAGDPGRLQAGIGYVLTGDNLVNFAIAIGMLLVGINVTRRLGGIGSDWAGKAVDYGKKATYVLSGAMAARAIAQKGAQLGREGASLAARKVPIVGGEAMARYGSGIKSMARSKWAGFQEGRSVKATEYLKDSLDKDKGWIARQVAKAKFNATAPGKVLDKLAKNREEEAEAREASVLEAASLSAHPASQRKLKAEQRLDFQKKTGYNIKLSKEADERERREQMFEVINSPEFKGDANKEKRLEKLQSMGLNAQEVDQFERDNLRREKSRDERVKMEGKEEVAQLKEQKAVSERKSTLGRQIMVGGEDFVLDENDKEASLEKFEKFLDGKRVTQDMRKELLEKFNRGQVVNVGGESVEVTANPDAAKARLAEIRRAGTIDDKQLKRYEQQIDYQSRQVQAANLAKVGGQMGLEATKQRGVVEAREEERLFAEDKAFVARDVRITDMGVEMKQIQDKLDFNSQLGLLASIRDLLASELGSRRMDEISKMRADVQNKTESKELVEREKMLRSRADDYRKNGDKNRADIYEKRANSVQFEALREGLKGRRGLELVGYINNLSKEVKSARDSGDSGLLDKKLKEMYAAVSLARGHEEKWVSRAADRAVIAGAGIKTEGLNNQEIALSIDLGGNIKELGLSVGSAADEITAVLGGRQESKDENLKRSQAMLRERSMQNEVNAIEGIIERGNMVNDAVVEGSTVYSINKTAVPQTASSDYIKAIKGLINLKTIINAPVSIENRNSDNKIVRVASDELKILSEKVKKITTTTGIDQINDRLINDLNSAMINANDAASKQAIKDFYEEMKADMKAPVFEAFRNRTKEFYDSATK